MILTLLFPALGNCHSWDTVPRWTDVFVRGDGFQELESKLEFLMDNYDIISLEKCLHQTDENTEQMFLELTSRMRELRPESEAKILFYWHLTQTFGCYQANEDFLARPDLWLYDRHGYPVIISNSVHWDFRSQEARDLWSEGQYHLYSKFISTVNISVASEVISKANGQANGVFVDGTHELGLKDCGFKTCGEDGKSCCVFSAQDQEDYSEVVEE